MAIKMRRGLIADLDRSKLVAGEIVMSTDTGFVGIAKAPSDVLELAKKDDLPDQVIANPSGTATDDLTKIQIGNTVYGIEGGSGEVVEMTYAQYQALTQQQKMDGTVRYVSDYPSGGGSGAGYTKELVYDSGSWSTYAPYNTDVSFTKSIAEFDQLLFIVASPDDDPASNKLTRSALIIDIDSVSEWGYFTFYQSRTLRLVDITNTTFNYYSDVNVTYDRNKQLAIYKIYGIKFGGSSLPDYSITEQKTGQKWIDGKDIYQKTWYYETPVTIPASGGGNISIDDVSFIDVIISALFIRPTIGNNKTYQGYGICGIVDDTHISARVVTGFSNCQYITLQYTKK